MPTAGAAAPFSLRDWLAHAERAFRSAGLAYGHGTHSAREEAAWLMTSVLGIPHEQLEASLDRRLTAAERRQAERWIARRVESRAPLAYLLHEAWLGEHRFYVDRRAIVPRSFIAELLRERLAPWLRRPDSVGRALDLCTGSGCLAVLVALAFPRARVDAADISAPALAVARRNIAEYRLGQRVRLLRSDLFAALEGRQYDLIVSNPPYVDARAMARLPDEYRREPGLALAGGADGLALIRPLLREAPRFLRPGGLLVAEVGHRRRQLERAFPGHPFTWLETSAGDDIVFLLAKEDFPAQRQGGLAASAAV